jgi:nitrite reductase (NADH) small subunit/3-phenylpropionate/trans-cinnamate dioxygenase ferredoxin subunit
MSDFQTVAKVGDIPEGEARAYEVNGVMVAVFHVGGEYTAMDDCCPHQGAPLSEGYIEGECVTCPWHAWRFSVKDGSWLDNRKSKLKVEMYEVRVEGEAIQIRVPD